LNLFAYTSQKVQIRLEENQLLRKIAGSSSKQDAMVLPSTTTIQEHST